MKRKYLCRKICDLGLKNTCETNRLDTRNIRETVVKIKGRGEKRNLT